MINVCSIVIRFITVWINTSKNEKNKLVKIIMIIPIYNCPTWVGGFIEKSIFRSCTFDVNSIDSLQ